MGDVITSFETPDGVRLVAEPFSEPNKNAPCELVSEVKFHGDRRIVRIKIANLEWMNVSDIPILTNALRALADVSRRQKPTPARKSSVSKKKPKKAATRKKKGIKKR